MNQSLQQKAKLEVPSAADEQGIRWRLDLFAIAGRDHAEHLKFVLENDDAQNQRKWLQLVRNHPAFLPDELDLAELFAGRLFPKAANGGQTDIIALSPTARQLKHLFGDRISFSDEEISGFKKDLVLAGKNLFTDALIRIRAIYAAVELLAMRFGPIFLPELVSRSAIYLGCEWGQTQPRKLTFDSQFGDPKSSKNARNILKELTKSLNGNRNAKSRMLPYWKIDGYVHDLEKEIVRIRSLKKNNRKELLDMFCRQWEIPDEVRGLIVDPSRSPRRVAREIVVSCNFGHIKDDRTLTGVVRPQIREIFDRPRFRTWNISQPDYFMLMNAFLDAPTRNPEVVAKQKWAQLLNEIPLKQILDIIVDKGCPTFLMK